jgi:hypothetical protein
VMDDESSVIRRHEGRTASSDPAPTRPKSSLTGDTSCRGVLGPFPDVMRE